MIHLEKPLDKPLYIITGHRKDDNGPSLDQPDLLDKEDDAISSAAGEIIAFMRANCEIDDDGMINIKAELEPAGIGDTTTYDNILLSAVHNGVVSIEEIRKYMIRTKMHFFYVSTTSSDETYLELAINSTDNL